MAKKERKRKNSPSFPQHKTISHLESLLLLQVRQKGRVAKSVEGFFYLGGVGINYAIKKRLFFCVFSLAFPRFRFTNKKVENRSQVYFFASSSFPSQFRGWSVFSLPFSPLPSHYLTHTFAAARSGEKIAKCPKNTPKTRYLSPKVDSKPAARELSKCIKMYFELYKKAETFPIYFLCPLLKKSAGETRTTSKKCPRSIFLQPEVLLLLLLGSLSEVRM